MIIRIRHLLNRPLSRAWEFAIGRVHPGLPFAYTSAVAVAAAFVVTIVLTAAYHRTVAPRDGRTAAAVGGGLCLGIAAATSLIGIVANYTFSFGKGAPLAVSLWVGLAALGLVVVAAFVAMVAETRVARAAVGAAAVINSVIVLSGQSAPDFVASPLLLLLVVAAFTVKGRAVAEIGWAFAGGLGLTLFYQVAIYPEPFEPTLTVLAYVAFPPEVAYAFLIPALWWSVVALALRLRRCRTAR